MQTRHSCVIVYGLVRYLEYHAQSGDNLTADDAISSERHFAVLVSIDLRVLSASAAST